MRDERVDVWDNGPSELDPENVTIAFRNAFDPVAKIRTALTARPHQDEYGISSYFDPRITENTIFWEGAKAGLTCFWPIDENVSEIFRQTLDFSVVGTRIELTVLFPEYLGDEWVEKVFPGRGIRELVPHWRAIYLYQALVGLKLADDLCRLHHCGSAMLFFASELRELLFPIELPKAEDSDARIWVASRECGQSA